MAFSIKNNNRCTNLLKKNVSQYGINSEDISFDYYTVQDMNVKNVNVGNSKYRIELDSENPFISYQVWNSNGYKNDKRLIVKKSPKSWHALHLLYNMYNNIPFTPTTTIDIDGKFYVGVMNDYKYENDKLVLYFGNMMDMTNSGDFSQYNNNSFKNVRFAIDSFLDDVGHFFSSAASTVGNFFTTTGGAVVSGVAATVGLGTVAAAIGGFFNPINSAVASSLPEVFTYMGLEGEAAEIGYTAFEVLEVGEVLALV